jgi:hypothetical protein
MNVTPGANQATLGLGVTVGAYPAATIARFSSGSVTALAISGSGMTGTGSFNYSGSLDIRGNVLISGSLITSGSDQKGINTLTTTLHAGAGVGETVNWGSGQLFDNTGINTVDWLNGQSLISPSYGGVTTVQWGAGRLISLSTSMSLDWENRAAYDTIETISLDWGNRILYDPAATFSIDWNSRTLNDSSGNGVLYWDATNEYKSIFSNYYYKLLISTTVQDEFIDIAPTNAEVNSTGEVIEATLDGTVATHDLVYLATDRIWYPITQSTDQCSKLIGICVSAGKSLVLLEGTLTVTSNGGNIDSPYVQALDTGVPIYIRNGSGTAMSTISPTTSGNYVRVLGHAYQRSSTYSDYWVMKFRPSNDWITI